jgi:hypothetical protein
LKTYKKLEFWLSMILLLITIIFSGFAYVFWYELLFFVGPFLLIHWLGLIGSIFVGSFIPIYYVLKRKRLQNRKNLLRIHVFGNLLAFLLISIHFAQNIGRLANFYPKMGDGIVLFLVLATFVITGFTERFQLIKKWAKYNRFVHRYSVVIFYLIVILHTLQGF